MCQSLYLSSYQDLGGRYVAMKNGVTAHVLKIGHVNLKLSSENTLTLLDVHRVLNIQKNLISRYAIVQRNYKLYFESNMVVITNNNIFIGKWFICDGFFKLNLINDSEYNKIDFVALSLVSSNIWHNKLGHVNFNSLKRLMNFNLIPNSSINFKNKCQICM